MTQTGRSLTIDDIVEAMEERRSTDPYEPWTATEVAEEFGVSRPTAFNRLREMEDWGSAASKKVGSGARVFWLVDTEDDR